MKKCTNEWYPIGKNYSREESIMRKHHLQQIQDILQTINQAQQAGLYADCQEGAYSICDFIDIFKNEGTKTVSLLEEYCELLFKAHNGEVGDKLLKKQLVKVENSIKHELKPKLEIAFLSYKASMSDSIESIYLAAKSDPDCDAFFIPIPYFDCKAGGSLGEMHYEGMECYSDYIQITDWQAYNIEERRPDVIVTFAPYDGNNIVTRVHPDFFCERLRKLTDMLIYIPYFVTVDDIQESHVAAGCLFAHKVIVQSEKIRDSYIRQYKKTFAQVGDAFGKPEDKFVALGSPKFDKVVNFGREHFYLPASWRKLIGGKKAILFNSSISAILQGNVQYLEKLHHVLETFRNSNDVVLWWRPHPLNETTYQSMRPGLLNEYKQIIAKYKNENWGIYDDTPDLHRAIAWTDAYYGDWSSLVAVYQFTGNPIMISNKKVSTDRLQFSPFGVCFSDECIWFTLKRFNGLLKMDKTDFSLKWMGSFPEEKSNTGSNKNSLYFNPVEKEGVLYFPPFSAREFALYTISNGIFKKVPYLKKLSNTENQVANWDFLSAVAYKDFIFFTPLFYHGIVKLNTKTNEISYYTDYMYKIEHYANNAKNGIFGHPLVMDQFIWLVSLSSNTVVSFNMENGTSTVYEIGQAEYKYKDIRFDGENFWLSPNGSTDTPIVKWNPTKGILKEFPKTHEFESTKAYTPEVHNRWHNLFYANGYIWMFPRYAQHVIKIEIDTDIISIAEEFERDCFVKPNELNTLKFTFVAPYGNKLYAFKETCGTFIEYDFDTGSRREATVQYTPEIIEQLRPIIESTFMLDTDIKGSVYNSYYYETGMIHLNDFISYVISHGNDEVLNSYRSSIVKDLNTNPDGTAGEAIYAYAKKTVLG